MLSLSVLYRTVLGAVLLVALALVGVKANSWLKTTSDSSHAEPSSFSSSAPPSSPERELASPVVTLYTYYRGADHLQSACLATAFDHTGLSYRFVTTKECVVDDNSKYDGQVAAEWRFMYIHFSDGGEHGPNCMTPAYVIAVRDGLAVLEARLEAPIFTMPFVW